MKTVTVNKDDLRGVLQENRDAHKAIFTEAVEGYREEAVRLLEEHIKRIRRGKVGAVYVSLPVPQDHTKDYDRVLKMLDMSVGPTIEMEQAEFAQYVMDDWTWKREFLTAASTYNSALANDALNDAGS